MKKTGMNEIFKANEFLIALAKAAKKPVILPCRENCDFTGMESGTTTMPPDVTGVTITMANLTSSEVQEIVDFIMKFERNRLAKMN